ncbi:MAG: trypsin-like peptidase domain-containing protein [Alloprevotella sp.]
MNKNHFRRLLVALLVCLSGTGVTTAQDVRTDLTYAAENCVNSVVYIKVTINSKTQTIEYNDPFEDFFSDFFGRGFGGGNNNGQRQQRQIQTPKRRGAGSGVILSQDGYIVTNNHVVADADELLVKLNDNREFKGRIIGTDKTTDLALIKIEESGLPAIKIGDSQALKLGEWVLAIGNPFSLTSTVTAGIVSAKARSLGATGGVESFIQTDAAINPGNSGGALVNAKGELVGINAMLYSQTGSYSGYGFAIPTAIMNKVVDDLKKFGTVQRALLGISGTDVSNYIDREKEKGNDVDLGTVNGVYIDEVSADGAAAEGNLQKGDVITAIDGKKIEKFGELQEILTAHRPGDKVTVSYVRNKKVNKATLTLRNIQGTTSMVESLDEEALGASLRELTVQEKRELSLRYGLMVNAIREGKMKAAGITKGLIITKVNNQEMNKPSDFDEAVKAANMSSDRVLWIQALTQSGIKKSFVVELGSDEKQTPKK